MTGDFIKRGNSDTDMTYLFYKKMKVETGMMFLQAKKCQRLSASHQKLGERCETDAPSQSSEGINAAHTLVLDFQTPEL